MGRKRNREFNESAALNMSSFRYYLYRFKELAISNIKWIGLPDTCNPRFLESALFDKGIGVVFKDEVTEELLSLYCMGASQRNVYNDWSKYYAYSANLYKSRMLDASDSVLIFNNMLHDPSYPVALFYARKLYEIDRTIEINVRNARQPKVILCDEKQRLSFENLIMQADGGYNNIFADKALNLESIKVLDLQAPYLCDKLQQLKIELWNEALTYLGISNSVVQKRERLISDEVLTNQGGIIASRNSRLYERQIAADKINKLFGLNVTVDFNDAFTAELQGEEEPEPDREEDIDE